MDRLGVRVVASKMHGEKASHLLEVLVESLADDVLVKSRRLAQEVEGVAVKQLLLAVRSAHAVASSEDQFRIKMVKAALEIAAIRHLAQQVGTAEHLTERDGPAFIPGEELFEIRPQLSCEDQRRQRRVLGERCCSQIAPGEFNAA